MKFRRSRLAASALALALTSGAALAAVTQTPAAADGSEPQPYYVHLLNGPEPVADVGPEVPKEGPASEARFANFHTDGVVVGSGGVLYIADSQLGRIVSLTRQPDGGFQLAYVAGNGSTLMSTAPVTGAIAKEVRLQSPGALAFGPDDRLYFAVNGHGLVLRLEEDGTLTRIAGTGVDTNPGEGPYGAPTSTALSSIGSLTFASNGDLLMTVGGRVLRLTDPGTTSATLTRVAGKGFQSGQPFPPLATQTPQTATEVRAIADTVAEGPDGALYTGSFQGISKIADGKISVISNAESRQIPDATPVPLGSVGIYAVGGFNVIGDRLLFTSSHQVLELTLVGAPMVRAIGGTSAAGGFPTPGLALESALPNVRGLAYDPETGSYFVTPGHFVTVDFISTVYYHVVELSLNPGVERPGIPGTPSAEAGYGDAVVTVAPPTTGGPVTSYTVTASEPGKTCTVAADAVPLACTVTGLTPGSSTTFTALATGPGGSSAPSEASAPVTILAKTPVTISASNLTKAYGDDDPTLTYEVTGLEDGDTLTTEPTCAREPDESLGAKTVRCSGATAPVKYDLQYTDGTLTIGQRPITVTPDGQSVVFGEDLPTEYPFTVTSGSLVNGDKIAGTCGVAGSPAAAGRYPITCSLETSDNYRLSVGSANLVITKRPGVVIPDSRRITYGDPSPEFTYTVSGLPDGYELAQPPVCAAQGDSRSAGTAVIACSGGSDPNIELDQRATAVLTVDQRLVTITAQDQTKVYGDPDPSFGYSVAGLVNGDALTKVPTCGFPGTATNVGEYSIVCTGASAGPNYRINSVAAVLTITKRPLTVTGSGSSEYGVGPGATPPVYSGFAAGEGPAVLDVAPVCSTPVTAQSLPGTYPVTCTAGSDANYAITVVEGTWRVEPASVRVSTRGTGGLTNLLTAGTAFTANLTHARTGAAVPGVVVTFRLSSNGKFQCQAVTNASGVATCRSVHINLGTPYTASSGATAAYLAGQGEGQISYL